MIRWFGTEVFLQIPGVPYAFVLTIAARPGHFA
jgi:hypothetical protein